jgi:hypothetical protein
MGMLQILHYFVDVFASIYVFAVMKIELNIAGPLPETLEDFWHMVWTEGCGKIVMLTNLCEAAKVCLCVCLCILSIHLCL